MHACIPDSNTLTQRWYCSHRENHWSMEHGRQNTHRTSKPPLYDHMFTIRKIMPNSPRPGKAQPTLLSGMPPARNEGIQNSGFIQIFVLLYILMASLVQGYFHPRQQCRLAQTLAQHWC